MKDKFDKICDIVAGSLLGVVLAVIVVCLIVSRYGS